MQVSSSTIPNPEELLITASDSQDAYLIELLNQSQALGLQVIDPEMVALLNELRDRASQWVKKLTLPTRRDEEWRFTDLSPLVQVNFQTSTTSALPESLLDEFALPEAPIRLAFVNGVYAPQLSSLADLPEGLVVSNLAQLPVTHRSRVGEYLAQQQGATEVFTALNTASLTDAAVVWVAKNTVVRNTDSCVVYLDYR
jgi:Fe-S cluster assembly protein SufD